MFDRELGVVELRGADRVSWLQGMVSNDVARLSPGQGCYAAHLNYQGRMLSQMVVLAYEDAVWLELEEDNIASTIEELEKLLIMEDVELRSLADEFSVLTLVGDDAGAVLEEWSGASVALESYFDHKQVGNSRVVFGELGFDLIVPNDELSGVRKSLLGAGSSPGAREAWNQLRIEAGLPVYGVDLDERTTLPEIGEKGIDYDKGCYIGQEVVAKIKYVGHVNRRFVGLKLEGPILPAQRSPIRQAEREIGQVTSSVRSATLNSGIALALVRHGYDKPGSLVEVVTNDTRVAATVVGLPFVLHQELFHRKHTKA